MERKQFIHLVHDQNASFILAFDPRLKQYDKLSLTSKISLVKESKRICIGSYNLGTKQEEPCKTFQDLTDSRFIRCKECETLTGFNDCVRCNGLSCVTKVEKAIHYCNEDHAVYLAYFPGGVVKVGTSQFQRKEKRILEQGAIAAIFICKCDGKLAREIEYYIGRTGIKTRVNADYKLKNLYNDQSEVTIKGILMQTLNDLTYDVLQPYTFAKIDPLFFSQYHRFQKIKEELEGSQGQLTLDFLGQSMSNREYDYHKDFTTIDGEVVTCVGNTLVIKKSRGVSAYDLSKIKGYVIQYQTSNVEERVMT